MIDQTHHIYSAAVGIKGVLVLCPIVPNALPINPLSTPLATIFTTTESIEPQQAMMDGLPAELIDQICDCLAGDVKSSKSLRVVGRRFSRTAQYIFHTLILYPHGDQWRNLNNIARVPALAKLVHTIKLVRERDLPIYGSFESFKHGTEPLRRMVLDGPNILMRSLATTTASEIEAILKQAYKAYAYWSVGSNQIKVWHAQALRYREDRNAWIPPRLHLDRLSNFQTLQTIGQADLCMLNGAGQCYGREIDYITRQESETLIAHRWRQNEVEDNKHLELFLLWRKVCGKAISTLALHDVYEIITPTELLVPFSHMRTLEIDLTRMARESIRTVQWLHSHSLTKWYIPTGHLENLSLIQDPRTEIGIDLVAILGQRRIRNLKTLYLKHITTPEDTLRGFIRAHKTLVSITVEEPLIKKRKWDFLRRAIVAGADSDVFLPKEGTKLLLTDSYFQIYPRRLGPGEIVPKPPAWSNYWDVDA